MEQCTECKGTGRYPDESECIACYGRGWVAKNGDTCGACNGGGCYLCGGTGWRAGNIPEQIDGPPRVISARELLEALDSVLRGEDGSEYVKGVIAGLMVQSQIRTEEGGTPGRLLAEMFRGRAIIIKEDGIYTRGRAGVGVRLVSFEKE